MLQSGVGQCDHDPPTEGVHDIQVLSKTPEAVSKGKSGTLYPIQIR